MKTINIIVPGRPVPAVRMTQKSMHVNKYAKRYLQYKKQVGWIARSHMQGEPIEGDAGVRLTLYIHGRNHGDIDNLFKGVTDALNKIVYKDDRQIKRMESKIIPCDKTNERAEVEVYELTPAHSIEMRHKG